MSPADCGTPPTVSVRPEHTSPVGRTLRAHSGEIFDQQEQLNRRLLMQGSIVPSWSGATFTRRVRPGLVSMMRLTWLRCILPWVCLET